MNPLDLLEAPMRAVLEFFHTLGFTWGWAIVMLTLVVRLLLLPPCSLLLLLGLLA